MNKKESRFLDLTLGLILAVAMLGMMGGALIGPVLPTLEDPFGVSEEAAGLVLGVYTLSTAIMMPFIGLLIDRYGRKPILIPCLLINGIFGGLCSLAPDFKVMLIFRALQGIGIAGMAPVAMTLIGDFYDGLVRTKAMGYYSAIMSIGGVTAPIIGGGLATLSWSFPFLFYLITIPLAISVWLWLPSSEVEAKSLVEYLKPFVDSFKELKVLAVLLAGFLTFFLLYAVVIYLPYILVRDYGFSVLVAGIFLGIQGAVTAIVSLYADKIVRIVSERNIVSLGFFLHGIAIWGLPYKIPFFLIIILLAILGLGRGLVMPQINTLVTRFAPESGIGGLVAVFSTIRYVGMSAAPIVLGFILIHSNLQVVFWFSSVLAIVAFLIGVIKNLIASSWQFIFNGA